jgi:hypothetical protein
MKLFLVHLLMYRRAFDSNCIVQFDMSRDQCASKHILRRVKIDIKDVFWCEIERGFKELLIHFKMENSKRRNEDRRVKLDVI